MKINYVSLLLTLMIIHDYFMLITQCTNNGVDNNLPLTLENRKAPMKRLLSPGENDPFEVVRKSVKYARSMEKQSRLGRSFSIGFDTSNTGVPNKWTTEKRSELLRFFYTNKDVKIYKNAEVTNWKAIHLRWRMKYGNMDSKHQLRSSIKYWQERMYAAVPKEEEGIRWTEELNDNLLRIYYGTEEGDSSKHGERIYAEWVKRKYPGYTRLTPEYLLKRAHTMLGKVMKISLNNQQDVLRDYGQKVDWKDEHDNYLIELWNKNKEAVKGRSKRIYEEAINKFPALCRLRIKQLYDRAKFVKNKEKKLHEMKDMSRAFREGPTCGRYYTFMDDQNVSSGNCREIDDDHSGMKRLGFQPKSSHDQPNSKLDPIIPDADCQSPDTNLYLGFRS